MKVWTTKYGPKRVLHAQLGRWKFSARQGRLFGIGIERQAVGAYAGYIGPVFFTAVRQAKQKIPPFVSPAAASEWS